MSAVSSYTFLTVHFKSSIDLEEFKGGVQTGDLMSHRGQTQDHSHSLKKEGKKNPTCLVLHIHATSPLEKMAPLGVHTSLAYAAPPRTRQVEVAT